MVCGTALRCLRSTAAVTCKYCKRVVHSSLPPHRRCRSLLRLLRPPGVVAPHPPACAGDENPGRIAADIVFVLQEKAHPLFRRDGNDLVYTHR